MMMELVPGHLITPSIRLNRGLGRGGMGSLWLADHLRLKVPVVVKFIASEFAGNLEVMARFQREAAATMAAKGAHVVQILDYGFTEQEVPFIAMEFLDGEDLAAKIDREARISPGDFAELLKQSCKALTRAHAQGIIHRDIKPENIFLTYVDGELVVKVLDFGIAKAVNGTFGLGATNTGAFLGTAYYMSPEQTMGAKTIDHRTDLWALGVVAYYALTGVRPFDAEAIGALVAQITSTPIAPPTLHVPSLGADIDYWMRKALARDPNERFSTARDMSAAFEQAASPAVRRIGAGSSDPPPLGRLVTIDSFPPEQAALAHRAIPLDTPDPTSQGAQKSGAGPTGTVPYPGATSDDSSGSYPSAPILREAPAAATALRTPRGSPPRSFARTVAAPPQSYRGPLLLALGLGGLLLALGFGFSLSRGADSGLRPNQAALLDTRASSAKVVAAPPRAVTSEPLSESAQAAAPASASAAPTSSPALVRARPVAQPSFNRPAPRANATRDKNPFDGTY
jgi:eukaryotic-like serine/threonine-protein kinase